MQKSLLTEQSVLTICNQAYLKLQNRDPKSVLAEKVYLYNTLFLETKKY